ncbi:MAG: glycoside hydrolase family 18 protein [Anaerolineales bacterium]|nr:glycoside hydrolase family 18 protein [Anaerolineales bacterium]
MKLTLIILTLVLLTSCGGNSSPLTPPATVPVSTTSPTLTESPVSTPIPFTVTPEGWCTHLLQDNFVIIGYLPEYRELNPEWGKCLTDIVYFSAEPRTDATLDISRLSDVTWQGLQTMKANYGTRIHLSVGGWERSQGFAPMVAKTKSRAAFIQNLLEFATEHKLDGVDFDWEFPETKTEFNNYIAFLTEIKTAFAKRGLIVSVALSADNASSMDLSQFEVVDRIHVMSYDRGALHSTYDMAIEDLNTFIINDIPEQKLFLGVPFYGRKMDAPFTSSSYQEIMTQYRPSDGLDQMDGIFFNGISTVQHKTCFVRENDFGGIMIWELGQDTWDETSLLRAIYQAAANGC